MVELFYPNSDNSAEKEEKESSLENILPVCLGVQVLEAGVPPHLGAQGENGGVQQVARGRRQLTHRYKLRTCTCGYFRLSGRCRAAGRYVDWVVSVRMSEHGRARASIAQASPSHCRLAS